MGKIYNETEKYYNSLSAEQKHLMWYTMISTEVEDLAIKVRQEHSNLSAKEAIRYVKTLFKVIKNYECGKLFPNKL